MDPRHLSQPRPSRTPLGDATQRHINAPTQPAGKRSLQVNVAETGSFRTQQNPQILHPAPGAPCRNVTSAPAASQAATTVASGTQIDNDTEKRTSQISTSSGASGNRRKTHIGPWQLGKTLGKGSAGRVRLARHRVTGENVAVKILPKHGVQMTQAGSLQDIDKWDRKQPEFANGNRIPLSIEREVALLKLIEHPNIMKIYDIWENRSEIYLVLEYMDQGDLFEYINTHQYLDEEETIWFFRQIISALDYCHSFNICHRDLKPENILISNDGFIKIADFGMAAIQQSPSHWLRTACGSPHYAAPELVSRRRGYEGHKVDIWSAGVILYACLCGRLPFDDKEGNMPRLLAKARKGKYHEPEWLSWLSKDLIRRMLQPDPAERIAIKQIWKHGLVAQYDHFDDMVPKGSNNELDVVRDQWRTEKLHPEDIDRGILRQLRSLWHMYQESELATKLVSEEPNDQKLFYFLLLRYTQRQLEDYRSSIPHSPSDFHHLQPPTFKRKATTLQFPAGYGRSASRFTVISNVATDENGLETATDGGGTVRSYDPFKSSQIMGGNDASHAKIIVHRNGSMARSSTRATNMDRRLNGSIRSTSTYSRRTKHGRRGPASAALHSSRRSIASFRSAEGAPVNRPISKHKRGVDFSHMRKLAAKQHNGAVHDHHASTIRDEMAFDRVYRKVSDSLQRTRPTRDAGRAADGTQSMEGVSQQQQPPRIICGDDLIHFSSSIAQDCDQAFNSTLILPASGVDGTPVRSTPLTPSLRVPSPDNGSMSFVIDTPTPEVHQGHGTHHLRPWDSRPLPPAPPPTDLMQHEMMVAKSVGRSSEPSQDFDNHGNHIGSHLAQRKLVGAAKQAEQDRRAVSAPIYSQYSTQWGKDAIPLPAITETRKETLTENSRKPRMSSAPVREEPYRQTNAGYGVEHRGLEYLARQEKTIRMVTSPPTKQGPVQAPEPLRLSKGAPVATRIQRSTDLRQQYVHDGTKEGIPEDPSASSNKSSSTALKKKSSWFRRGSKGKDDVFSAQHGSGSSRNEGVAYTESSASTAPLPPTKKKSFSLAFWRSSRDQNQMQLSLGGLEPDETPTPEPVRVHNHPGRPPREEKGKDDVTTRNIEPQQNWLARLFRVKPATEHLCFAISRRSARQEIAILLKEWRRYGIRDVQVDKDRNIVFGRVGPKNYLNLKEVSFAAEVMTVIEHGNRNALSIVRFTQERGAASSFNKVVDTMHAVFSVRNLLVTDRRKIKMMVKTLNSR